MPTPEFILNIREKIGHDPLWLPGVGAVVFNERGEVLLVRRADTLQWTIVTGIPEPGEEPAAAMVREVFEETGIRAQMQRVVKTGSLGPMAYPNGDQCYFMDVTFRAIAVAGTARVNDDESTEVGWFTLDSLPELNATHAKAIELAVPEHGEARFDVVR